MCATISGQKPEFRPIQKKYFTKGKALFVVTLDHRF